MFSIAQYITPEAIQSSGYLLIFILMLLEGPTVTYLASFAASLGFFNIYFIIILSIFSSVIPDSLLYLIGRSGRKRIISFTERYFKLSRSFILKLEKGFRNNAGKTIALVKLVPPLPVPGLILAGIVKVPYAKFFYISTIVSIVGTVATALLGFYTGQVYLAVSYYSKRIEIAIIVSLILAVISYLVFRMIKKRFTPSIVRNKKRG